MSLDTENLKFSQAEWLFSKAANCEIEASEQMAEIMELYSASTNAYLSAKESCEPVLHEIIKKRLEECLQKMEYLKSQIACNVKTKERQEIGLAHARRILDQSICLREDFPELFSGNGRKAWNVILLFGVPGTGKTHLVSSIAAKYKIPFFLVTPSTFSSELFGKSEQLITELFQEALNQPRAVIFLDEIDSFLKTRTESEYEGYRKIKNELLVQMNLVKSSKNHITMIGATNRPYDLDSAALSRFEKIVYVPPPATSDIIDLLKTFFEKTTHTLCASDFTMFAKKLEGYSVRDIEAVVDSAVMLPVEEMQKAHFFKKVCVREKTFYTICDDDDPLGFNCRMSELKGENLLDRPISKEDMLECIQRKRGSVNSSEVQKCNDFNNKFGTELIATSIIESDPPAQCSWMCFVREVIGDCVIL